MRYTLFLLGILYCLWACSDNEVLSPKPETSEEGTPGVPENPDVTDGSGMQEKVSSCRMLWASINGRKDASYFPEYNNRVLVSWRLLPTDKADVSFDIYRKGGNGQEVKLNQEPINHSTNFQDIHADRSVNNTYRLTYSGGETTLDSYTLTAQRASQGLPYVSIPLQSTVNIAAGLVYAANDASVGDLDGDGKLEIVLKRLVVHPTSSDDDETGSVIDNVEHSMLLEAYRLDGTFLWRMALGPNILTGNGGSFAVYDFDGDGCCEVALRTSEGTIFGDGREIGDIDGDGITDYRRIGANYISGGPEFLSVVEGTTGRELARTNYIARGTSEEWGDSYYKRASSYRIAVARCDKERTSIIMGRGCYGKIVVEAWDYTSEGLERRWRFDTTADNGRYKDYEAQGYHSLSVGDVDNDGKDEIVYGSCTIDHDGKGLNSCGLGHGDALHLGKFDTSRKGLQLWSCFESGAVGAALRDAYTGKVIWKYNNPGDVGRCMVADIDPDSPGCEMWWYKGNAHSPSGEDLGYAPNSCNMAIWWNGTLNRQLLDKSTIDAPKVNGGRVFTLYRYNVTTINGTKANPCFYGDILGDWREEIIQPTSDNTELRIFSTWYPTEYRFPCLMSDHVYAMSALNQNIGYNQPTHTGYYLGSDLLKE